LNTGLFNPNAYRLAQYLGDTDIRFIVMFGGSSSGKSYAVAQMILLCAYLDNDSALVLRKVGASISKSIYEDFKRAARQLGLADKFKFQLNRITCNLYGAHIDFSGIDDPEKIKGISSYRRLVLEELSEFDLQDFKQLRKRLRGRSGQQIICTFNPIKETHWIKREWLDNEQWTTLEQGDVEFAGKRIAAKFAEVKSLRINAAKDIINPRTGEVERHAPDTIIIQSTYLNNFWVVGSPNGRYGYYDEQCIADFERDRLHDPDYYQVYALGEWGHIRTGGEFLPAFNVGTCCAENLYDPTLPLHVCMDSNVLPYVTITLWQKRYRDGDGVSVMQVGELTCEAPDNSARKAAKRLADHLRGLHYTDKVYLHGDASGRAANTIDENNRSFFDIVIDELQRDGLQVEDRIGRKNPSVALTGDFVNAIWDGRVDGVELLIDTACVTSTADYQAVQKDDNGGMLKTKVLDKTSRLRYEPHGHITDTMRYIVYDLLREHYTAYTMGHKRAVYADDALRYYNPAGGFLYSRRVAYIVAEHQRAWAFCVVGRVGDRWHVLRAEERDAIDPEELEKVISGIEADDYALECAASYFDMARRLRSKLGNLAVRKPSADARASIKATSAWVRDHVYFNADAPAEQATFVASLLDVTDTSPTTASAVCMSGLARYIIRQG